MNHILQVAVTSSAKHQWV